MEPITLKPYKTVDHLSECEFTEKRSRFIGRCWHVETEEDAASIIERIRKQCWDAKHNCYAYVLKDGNARYSDDGEPSGTAGHPILDRINRSGLTDTLIIVTRYFGGILLGTGGLVRAYSKSAGDAIEAAGLIRMIPCDSFSVKCGYSFFNTVKATCSRFGRIQNTVFLDDVEITVWVDHDSSPNFKNALTDDTEGSVHANYMETGYYPFPVTEDSHAK